jgi:AcrR family transcriptional regulator
MSRPDVSEERKAQVLAAARLIFSSQPYQAVTMRDIARKAKLSVGGVYWYFQSKDEILTALLQQNAEENINLIQRLLETDAPASRRLTLIFDHIARQVDDQSQLYFMGAKYHAMLSRDPDTITVMERLGTGYRAGLAALIEQGIARGEFARIDAQEIANTFMGAYEGLMLMWVISQQTLRLKETLHTAMQLLLAGLVGMEHQSDREEEHA